MHNVLFYDDEIFEASSYLVSNTLENNIAVDPTCSSADDKKCKGSHATYQAELPICSNLNTTNCISGFGLVNDDGSRTAGKFANYFPAKAQNEYMGNAKYNLPSGTAPSVFDLPSAPHEGGSQYYLSVRQVGSGVAGEKMVMESFSARITPIQMTPALNDHTCAVLEVCPNAGYALIYSNPTNSFWGEQSSGITGLQSCAMVDHNTHMCAERSNFPEGKKFYLTIRTTSAITGWLHGRLSDPGISITKNGTSTTLDFSGQSVAVPVLYHASQWSDLPVDIRDHYSPTTGKFISANGVSGGFSRSPNPNQSDPTLRNYTSFPKPFGLTGIEELQTWLPFMHDTSSGYASVWRVRTLSVAENLGANTCFTDESKLTGLVTNNSTEYSAGPPSFDVKSGTLSYKLASPHFLDDGSVFKGSYNLLMRSDVARCVYKFSSAPVKATVQVLSANGSPELATTVTSEKDGWLRLSANNFEFSSPKVSVKLQQAASANTSSSIQCVNETSKRIIKVTKPTCPVGFKKK